MTYLFVFFLSGYLESEAMVAIEICGQSDALLLWGGGQCSGLGSLADILWPRMQGAGRDDSLRMDTSPYPHSIARVHQ